MNDIYENLNELFNRFKEFDHVNVKNDFMKILLSKNESADAVDQIFRLKEEFDELSRNLNNLAQFIERKF